MLLAPAVMWALLILAPSPVDGHAILQRSLPLANASLATSPQRLELWFTEPVDPRFSTVEVLDRTGSRVGQGGRSQVEGDGRQIVLSVGNLPRGVYTVKWRILSAIDGHTTSGFFTFGVGELATETGSTGAELPGALRIVLRWAGFAFGLALAGVVFFEAAVLRPALSGLDQRSAAPIASWTAGRLRTLTIVAAPAFLVAVGLEFVVQAAELLGRSPLQMLQDRMIWNILGGTRAGWSAIVRGSMAVLLLLPASPRGRILKVGALAWVVLFGTVAAIAGGPSGLLSAGEHALPIILSAHVYALVVLMAALIVPSVSDVRVPEFQWVAAFAAPVLLAGFTLGAHASGSGAVGAFVDWLHLMAAAMWVGGLGALLFVLKGSADRTQICQVLVPRFSRMAGIALIVLTATGLYSTWLYVPTLRAFITTSYGRALLLKVLLVLFLAGLGAANRYVLVPRLRSALADLTRVVSRVIRNVSAEVALGGGVLLVVAVLTILPPALEPAPQQVAAPLMLAGLPDGLKVNLTLTPTQPSGHKFEVQVSTDTGEVLDADARVLIQLTKLDEALDPVRLTLARQEPERHVHDGAEMALPGWWEVQVIVRRRGKVDATAAFPVRVGEFRAPADEEASRLLQNASVVAGRLRSWRHFEQLTDGSGGVVVARYEVAAPDRFRYLTSNDGEAVFIGKDRHFRSGTGGWTKETGPPVMVENLLLGYLAEARRIGLGPVMDCGPEACRVVMWENPGAAAFFAARIGTSSGRIYHLNMIAPSHYMTLSLEDFDTPIRITPPK